MQFTYYVEYMLLENIATLGESCGLGSIRVPEEEPSAVTTRENPVGQLVQDHEARLYSSLYKKQYANFAV